MAWAHSSVRNWPARLPASETAIPEIPWEPIETVARFWAGSGSLLDWLVPSQWDVDVAWSVNQTRARVAEIVLLGFESRYARFLPAHAGEWLDILGQQFKRNVERVEQPTAHTDWAATLSEFGRYPSPLYVDRRPLGSFDTPYTRILKWTGHAVIRAEALILSQFGRGLPTPNTRARFASALTLPEVSVAATGFRPAWHDLDICRSAGGPWLIVARLADELSALWFGSPVAQLSALQPVLPVFADKLFELSTVGVIAAALREAVQGRWVTENPIAAGTTGEPCLRMTAGELTVDVYYQTVPQSRGNASTYRALTTGLRGGVLRPDLWVRFRNPKQALDLICECKFSLDASYVCTGVTQIMAYSLEFPQLDSVGIYFVVGPAEVVSTPSAHDKKFALGSQEHLAALIRAMVEGRCGALMDDWVRQRISLPNRPAEVVA